MTHSPTFKTALLPARLIVNKTETLLSLLLFVLSPVSLRADCATATLEAKQGSGGASKIGFACGDGCEKKVYRAMQSSGFTKTIMDGWGNSFGAFWDAHEESLSLYGNPTVISVQTSSSTCSQTATTHYDAENYTRHSVSKHGYYPIEHIANASSCQDDTFNPSSCNLNLHLYEPMITVSDTTTTETTPCGDTISRRDIEKINYGWIQTVDGLIFHEHYSSYIHTTTESSDSLGYSDEYTTAELIGQARACAYNSLDPETSFSAAVAARCAFSLSADKTAASDSIAKWRIAIRGTVADKKYRVHLTWFTVDNGIHRTTEEDRIIGGSNQELWYYPSADGEVISVQESDRCSYSYEKSLVAASIEALPDDRAPSSNGGDGSPHGGVSPSGESGGTATCTSCGTKGSGSTLDVGTFFSLDLGAGSSVISLGSLSLRSGAPTPRLATPAALELSCDPASAELDIRRAFTMQGELRQVSTPRAFINIAKNTTYKYAVRIMRKDAQGSVSEDDGFYTWSDNPAYLIKEYTIENPDASPSIYNRLRIRDVTSPSNPVEWMFTYSNAISGWTLTLPGNTGSVDLISTNHAATAWTYIRRHRAPSGQVIAQHSQVFTNFSWGPAILSETFGTGTDARTRSWTYYDPSPFAPTSSRVPLHTVVEPDGGWRSISEYDQDTGTVLVELSGIDTAETTDTSKCRRVVYSYDSEDEDNDDLTRNPDSPRKEEEYWKDQLIRRTYHVYGSLSQWFDRTVQCPNPTANSSIDDSANLDTMVYYIGGTARVSYEVNPDGTIVVPFTSQDLSGNTVTTTDQGEPFSNNPSVVCNGTRTETTTSPTGALISQNVWALSGGSLGPQLSGVIYSGFDDFDRATRADYLDLTYETFSYDCCGLDVTTDRAGISSRIEYDPLHRLLGHTILSYLTPISTTNILDAAGRITATVRNGGGNWAITNRQIAYNTAGRVLSEVNAMGGTTTHTETILAGCLRQQATTYPDGGTITNLYLPDGSLSNVTGTATSPLRCQYSIETDSGAKRLCTKEIKLDAGGNNTEEWTKNYQDGLGRSYKLVYAAASGSPAKLNFYNDKGQLEKEIDPDGVTTLYRYNGQGQLEVTATDLDQDGFVADYDEGATGNDRVTRTTTEFLLSTAPGNTRGTDIRRTETVVWTTAESDDTAKVNTTETSTDALHTWQTTYRDQITPVVTRTFVAIPTAMNNWTRTEIRTFPDNSTITSVSRYGRLTSVTHADSLGDPLTSTSYSYDAHGRQSVVTDLRNGPTTYAFNDADLVTSVTSPDAGTGPQVVSTSYDNMGRITGTRNPDGTTTTRLYSPAGLLTRTSGSHTYPVEYAYDPQGRMRTMKTWQSFAAGGGTATNRWNYDQYRGWLKSKDYPDKDTGSLPSVEGTGGPTYEYTPGGRLKTRTWHRPGSNESSGIVTAYTYGFDDTPTGNEHGDLVKVEYNNDPAGTPSTSYTYDRRGRRSQVINGGTTTTFTYNDASQPLTESCQNGILNGLSVNWTYNNLSQRDSLSLGGVSGYSVGYTYDNGRLHTVSEGNAVATYSYLDKSSLVSQILFQQGGQTRLKTTKQYDHLNRLQSISSVTNGAATAIPLARAYTYDPVSQRTRATLSDGSYWLYTYDALGQVTSGKRFWQDGTPVAGQQFEYAFDDIGNRTATKVGGDASGTGLRPATYTPNRLNQYSERTVPNHVDVLGIANPTASVTVNGNTAYRKGEYFDHALLVDNSGAAQYTSAAVASTYPPGDSKTGNIFVPRSPERFGYDADGNLTNDGRWSFVWDAENRLIKMEPSGTVTAPIGSRRRLEFAYDYQGRRIWERITNLDTSAVAEQRFVYDGWNLLASLNAQQATLINSLVWGLDLSGSIQGAGGVGGLLRVTYCGAQTTNAFVVYDGNGNVTALVNAVDGSVVAQYEYGPFGEVIRATGPMARVNPFRWSTQYTDDETDLVCYLHRYYNPSTGRWLSRDPIEEEGGLNLYAFVSGDPINKIDKFGLASSTTPGVPHVSNDRHNNYLIFYATCPAGWSVTGVSVTYDSEAMAHGLLVWAASSDERRQWMLDYNYGGLKSVGRSNCRGEPVEVQAYMRTRLVSPGWQFAAWRAANGLPGADDILALYQANTQIHWLCNNCCGRGTSTR